MIVLVVILIGIFINFYNTPIKVNYSNVTLSGNSSDTNHDNPIVIHSESGEFASNSVIDSDVTHSETIISENGEVNSQNNGDSLPKENEKPSQVIITSEDTMTNKEKREILTELDNTLMELLDAVDKVQTVDESRLNTEESGVQK